MKKIGIIGTPGGWSSERLADTVERKTGYRLLVPLNTISFDLETGSAWFKDTDISKLDALIIKKAGRHYSHNLLDRLEILRAINEKGLQVFSSPLRIIRVLDRLTCTVTLKNGGIPMPPTTITENHDAAVKAVEKYGEAVFKPLFSSKAMGMKIMRPSPELENQIELFTKKNSMMYIQKKVNLGGKDLGIVFLGGEYLATYARCNDGSSWNTTTKFGGKYQPYTPSSSIIEIAYKAQALFGLDFTCVDVAETDNGPVVFEVSAFGGFKGILTACKIDAAELYVDYVLNKIKA
ncbi:RimK-like ATP-grasp domain protein [Desulfamplus magnetovallimortis]|uniref:RimK-like ATP-grasp domain protein n=1 Tax=Desulfamplus magnetovallimortis TaxID=1246637 RepID=L0R4L0_9BACT|nr:GAK system ATP-grasp enzyme [Desulfamplus magnetovallimortis]CCO06804.1 RimK-like ATP-grasp domain protein [Desulfamplus magnetovallimortis BW-1]SLM32855.1 RimK-like ATP-grasp domain protein [Desulfamplus magnetovallimortis]